MRSPLRASILPDLTVLVLLPLGILVGRTLAFRRFPGKGFAEAMLALPLVLPPTVLGIQDIELQPEFARGLLRLQRIWLGVFLLLSGRACELV